MIAMHHAFKVVIALALLIAGTPWTMGQTSGTWALAGPVAKAATGPSSNLLQDGRVLIASGNIGGIGAVFPWAQVYDPVSNTFKATPNMKSPRNGNSGTRLPDGRVLLVGGSNGKLQTGDNLGILKTAELYDPAAGTFTLSAGRMKTARMGPAAVLLPGGKVLVTGGIYQYNVAIRWAGCTNTAELYDPATDSFSSAGTMSAPRCGHTATLLGNGRVLVVSGTTAELYDPATNSWSGTANPALPHTSHSAVVLPDGRVLMAGGTGGAEIYNPASASWSLTGSPANSYGANTAVLLATGKVLIVGGPAGQSELYDPLSGTWSATASLNTVRFGFGMSLLASGKVLVTDGATSYQIMSAEIYTP